MASGWSMIARVIERVIINPNRLAVFLYLEPNVWTEVLAIFVRSTFQLYSNLIEFVSQ